MLKYNAFKYLINQAQEKDCTISQLVIEDQMRALEMTRDQLMARMQSSYHVMKEAILTGVNSVEKSYSGLSGGDAFQLYQYQSKDKAITGPVLSKALAYGLAVAEVNACMGKIVAAPTAGSCGILPACMYALQEAYDIDEQRIVEAMFTASALGMVISNVATVAGAEGGCQAECGSAGAMAAGAMIELMGGSQDQVGQGAALALKAILGLVCDPVAGLVEVPCVKRNAMGVAQAFAATDMALSGIHSFVPVDEVIGAMKAIGDEMPVNLKETSDGGLADTQTARAFEKTLK